MFRLMGSGCFCLAYRHKDIEKEFREGLHLRTWETLDELETLIDWVSNSDIKYIAERGCDYVHERYTWPARLEQDLIPLL